MGAIEGQSPQPIPGYPNISIVNNINTDKKDDKKDDKKSSPYSPDSSLYIGLELVAIHRFLLNFTDEGAKDPLYCIYRTTYLASMAAGVAFGLYKSMTASQEVGLEKRAEYFGKESLVTKCKMGALTYLKGSFVLQLLRGVIMPEKMGPFNIPHIANAVPAYWGFSLGSDMSSYAYNNLVSKKQKSEEIKK
jgi:hypothetical protein